jgi:hypothetical protein
MPVRMRTSWEVDMQLARIAIVAGLLMFAVHPANAASAPRTMDLEIMANGQVLLRGEIIDNMDDLEAKLRIMRENEPPFDLSIRLPKTINLDAFAPFMKMLDDLRARFGFIGNGSPPKPAAPGDRDTSTI